MQFDTIINDLEEASKKLEAWAAAPANHNHAIAGDVDVIGWELLRNANDLRQIINHFGIK